LEEDLVVPHTTPQQSTGGSVNGAIPELGEYETVIVATPDLAGRLVGKRLTARHFRESGSVRTCDVVFGWGIGHELLDGFDTVGWEHGYGDIVSRPDGATIRPLAWWPGTALLMADALRPDGTPVAVAPRAILRGQVERARELGYEPLVTSELEFTLYAETPQTLRSKGFAALDLHHEELHPELVETTGLHEGLLAELRTAMEQSGVLVESVKAEYSPSQFEMTLEPADALELADRHAVYKLGVREICRRQGVAATFMAKPESHSGGQSCHLHVSLADDAGRNAFADGDDALLRHFVGGLQRYAADVFLLWAPYPNSYKRFRPGSFAPASMSWGEDNRTAALRVCGEGASRHLESRIPGADVNPYLAHAALLAAGLRGIADELDPGEGIGHANAYAGVDLRPLPANLDEAVSSFATSRFTTESFGADVVAHLANCARAELDASALAVTDFDRRRLFDI
jgi:glutamine synthetase